MAKYHYPPPQVVVPQTNATTASPGLVKAITLDAAYEAKTAQVVLTRDQMRLKMSVYRASTSRDALGMFSRDDFERTSAGLKSMGKAATPSTAGQGRGVQRGNSVARRRERSVACVKQLRRVF